MRRLWWGCRTVPTNSAQVATLDARPWVLDPELIGRF